MRLPDDAIARVLGEWPVARLATVGPDGRPHAVPIVFARVGDRLWSPVDGKPKTGGGLARTRNVESHPAVSLLLDDYTADWTRLWWVRVDAEASVLRDLGSEGAAEAVEVLRAKYPQYGEVPVLAEPPTLLAFDIRRIRSWCAGPDAIPR